MASDLRGPEDQRPVGMSLASSPGGQESCTSWQGLLAWPHHGRLPPAHPRPWESAGPAVPCGGGGLGLSLLSSCLVRVRTQVCPQPDGLVRRGGEGAEGPSPRRHPDVAALERAVSFLLGKQLPNGDWPQVREGHIASICTGHRRARAPPALRPSWGSWVGFHFGDFRVTSATSAWPVVVTGADILPPKSRRSTGLGAGLEGRRAPLGVPRPPEADCSQRTSLGLVWRPVSPAGGFLPCLGSRSWDGRAWSLGGA